MRFKPPQRVKQIGSSNVWGVSVPELDIAFFGTGRRRIESIHNAMSRVVSADHSIIHRHLTVKRDGFYQDVAPFIKGDPLISHAELVERMRGRNHLFTPREKRRHYRQLQTAIRREYWPWLAPLLDYLDLPQLHKHPRMKDLT